MAGDSGEEAKLTGLAKHFNSVTFHGRANSAKATLLVISLISGYFYFKPKKQTAAVAK